MTTATATTPRVGVVAGRAPVRPRARGRRVAAVTARAVAWTVVVVCVGAFAASTLAPLWFQVRDQRLLLVTSGSMAPAFQAGDAVVIQAIEDPSELRVGQVATFWPPGGDRLVTHRIVDLRSLPVLVPDPETGDMVPRLDEATGAPLERPYIVTKGDANETPDPDATPLSRVRGVVLEVHPGWGRVLGWAHSPSGRWTLLAPPLLALAALELVAAAGERRRRPAPRPGREEVLDAYLLD